MGGSYLLQSLRSKALRNPSLKRPDKPKLLPQTQLPRVESLHGLKLPQIKNIKRVGEGSLEKLSKPSFPSPRVKGDKSPGPKRQRENLDGVLNCSKLENEEKAPPAGPPGPTDVPVGDGDDGEDIMNSEEYIRKAKRYRLEDLDDEDDTFRDSTLPISKLVKFLDNIGWNYSIENLNRHRKDLNLVVAQPFEAIRKAQLVNEVIQLIFAMIKHNLIEEDVDYLNAVSVLLKAYPWLVSMGETTSIKMASKILDKLEALVQVDHHLTFQSTSLVGNFFAESTVSCRTCWKSPPLLAKGLRLMKLVYSRLLELASDEYDPTSGLLQLSKQTQYSLVEFFEKAFDDSKAVREAASASETKDSLTELVEWALLKVLSLDSSAFSSMKKTLIVLELFAIVFSVLQHPPLSESVPKVTSSTLGTLVEYLLSTIVTVLDTSLFSDTVKEKISLLLKVSTQAIQNAAHQELELLPLMQLLFKLLAERNYALTTPLRIQFALELVMFMKELVYARKDQFVSLYRNQKKPLELLVFNFSSATCSSGRKEFNRQKEQVLRPLVELIGLLKPEKPTSLFTLRD